jgi:N-methylhydantoinase A/oxoprolinase/acetone carboxylase beta subunit
MLLLGFDTGGTYTDAVLFDPIKKSVIASAKALTTKHDLSIGLRGALDGVLPKATGDIGLVSLSTTLATNAIVEGQGSPICLLLLGYEPQSLDRSDLRRALGHDPVVFIAGGHTPIGDEQAPLDRTALESAIQANAGKVAAFAVSGYFSVRNASHEILARQIIRDATGMPVTCGHELTSKLDAPRRALTAALNARLIPQLQHLIEAVRALLTEKSIRAPLMVVKGDGSLVTADLALVKPVETILSGPAASVVGARHLCDEDNVVVVDMGGTTTDIALLRNGRPVLDREGASVAGWKTMVEAIAVHTFGLGGDSEAHRRDGEIVVGPRRLVPLSLLAHLYPRTLESLRAQHAAERVVPGAGRFALRNRTLDATLDSLSGAQRQIWQQLEAGPMPVSELASGYAAARSIERLVDRGLIVISGLTPSDAAHILGLHADWSAEAARLGAEIWIRDDVAAARPADPTPVDLARKIVEAVTLQSGRAIVAAALENEGHSDIDEGGPLGRHLIDHALGPERPEADLLRVAIQLRQPVAAIGAPVGTYYPEVARRLSTRLVIPPFAGVCNAVGAVAGGVAQTVSALITAPNEGLFRVHLPGGNRDFTTLDAAADHAMTLATDTAIELARTAGADDIEVKHRRADKIHRDPTGLQIFIESKIDVTAYGRPRLATH